MCADPIRPRTRILVVAMLFLAAAAVAIPISDAILCSSTTPPEAPRSGSTASKIAPPSAAKPRSFAPRLPSKICSRPIACCPRTCLFSSASLGSPAITSAGRRGSFSSMERPSPRRSTGMPKAVPCRHGMGVSLSSPASFSSCNHILIRSTAGTLARSANAKSSASPTPCGPGIRANRTRVFDLAKTRSEE